MAEADVTKHEQTTPGSGLLEGGPLRPETITRLLAVLLALAIVRLWFLPLPSSFWVDEMVTAFVVHYGPLHPSLAVAPQVVESVYYSLPKIAEQLFGFSEVIYRLPSTLLMGVALFFIARLATRLIHPNAGWFAVFACMTLSLFNYQAADARPYALGTCTASIALWFLVRWLDTARWWAAGGFVLASALLWRVHLVYWPFYAVFVLYTVARLYEGDTKITWPQVALVYAALGAALVPVALHALTILRQAKEHVIVDHRPNLSELNRVLKLGLVAACAGVGALLSNYFTWPRMLRGPDKITFARSALVCILGWWLIHPLVLFVFSWATGNSVFVDRYLSLALPGAALTATLATAYFLPAQYWKTAALLLGTGVVLFMGRIGQLTPRHHNSDWRAASRAIEKLNFGSDAPVVYPSPFIEARPPVWKPDYRTPSFLYSHLLIYPAPGQAFLLPFETSEEAEAYARQLAQGPIVRAGRLVIYGGDANAYLWRSWFARQPELIGWRSRKLGPFGDVDVVVFEKP